MDTLTYSALLQSLKRKMERKHKLYFKALERAVSDDESIINHYCLTLLTMKPESTMSMSMYMAKILLSYDDLHSKNHCQCI